MGRRSEARGGEHHGAGTAAPFGRARCVCTLQAAHALAAAAAEARGGCDTHTGGSPRITGALAQVSLVGADFAGHAHRVACGAVGRAGGARGFRTADGGRRGAGRRALATWPACTASAVRLPCAPPHPRMQSALASQTTARRPARAAHRLLRTRRCRSWCNSQHWRLPRRRCTCPGCSPSRSRRPGLSRCLRAAVGGQGLRKLQRTPRLSAGAAVHIGAPLPAGRIPPLAPAVARPPLPRRLTCAAQLADAVRAGAQRNGYLARWAVGHPTGQALGAVTQAATARCQNGAGTDSGCGARHLQRGTQERQVQHERGAPGRQAAAGHGSGASSAASRPLRHAKRPSLRAAAAAAASSPLAAALTVCTAYSRVQVALSATCSTPVSVQVSVWLRR